MLLHIHRAINAVIDRHPKATANPLPGCAGQCLRLSVVTSCTPAPWWASSLKAPCKTTLLRLNQLRDPSSLKTGARGNFSTGLGSMPGVFAVFPRLSPRLAQCRPWLAIFRRRISVLQWLEVPTATPGSAAGAPPTGWALEASRQGPQRRPARSRRKAATSYEAPSTAPELANLPLRTLKDINFENSTPSTTRRQLMFSVPLPLNQGSQPFMSTCGGLSKQSPPWRLRPFAPVLPDEDYDTNPYIIAHK